LTRASDAATVAGHADAAGQAGTFPSKRTISIGSTPMRRASSSVDGAHV